MAASCNIEKFCQKSSDCFVRSRIDCYIFLVCTAALVLLKRSTLSMNQSSSCSSARCQKANNLSCVEIEQGTTHWFIQRQSERYEKRHRYAKGNDSRKNSSYWSKVLAKMFHDDGNLGFDSTVFRASGRVNKFYWLSNILLHHVGNYFVLNSQI